MCLMLASEQQARGHSVSVFIFRPGDTCDAIKKEGINVILPNDSNLDLENRFSLRRVAAEGLRKAVNEAKPDLIHSHVPVTNLICSKVLDRSRPPWVATVHGSWKQFGYSPQTVGRPCLKTYFLLRHAIGDFLTLRTAAGIAVPAQRTKELLVRIGVSGRKIAIIHNGLPPAAEIMTPAIARERLKLPLDSLVIGGLGYFAPVKGFDLLIRAFAGLERRNLKLLLLIAGGDVLGHSATRKSLERLTQRLNVADRVHFIGPLDPNEGFLSSLDIFVVSSRSEGMPLALIQAMQHGLPAVVSSEGGNSEAARNGLESLVFRSGSVGSLAAALERLILDEPMRVAFGRAASARASTYLTHRRCADDYERLYENIFEEPPPLM